ncbi:hypothetical protein K432DRAFT_125476 [Lepidopterella palustris CBS 459.81]|uniref:Uncharacterized protein n=1 Tax=Lepidopterella palustris CBS 459.81 TaxID=1314670 RepID=A0A8E2EI72_9PEZI|nr:hypothetical protein K432DRAFT_125476 [Lepidopterella palustris CBS 459.81]
MYCIMCVNQAPCIRIWVSSALRVDVFPSRMISVWILRFVRRLFRGSAFLHEDVFNHEYQFNLAGTYLSVEFGEILCSFLSFFLLFF